ncbi:putative D,D-dipeptide-binding periplasmic protein DdpA [Streptomyces sp. RB5]|uniref:Putative D,D-dipeptide-binding periplasmic protein DdpA n=1 Tax=Streptomyces smaragdinus TaxID=2585196 RepID=A0A7K0CAX0_9ACTN|nr:putative D,D-dipeptide-binding periplasmic protein DdpA [Streptomyces smaragdinus]
MFYGVRPLTLVVGTVMTVLISGCGVLSSDGGDGEQHITVGTTSYPSTLDPAKAWDGSWELYRNVFQTLLFIPTGSTDPEPEAAERCQFDDRKSTVYSCTLRKGLKFSNGNALDVDAVKHTFDRIVKINAKTGPAALLANLESVKITGTEQVTFRLKEPDSTFPFILATPATALVDPAEYPADKARPEDEPLIGSGPYTLESYEPGEVSELSANPGYKGLQKLKNKSVTIKYYGSSDKMMEELMDDKLDLTFRGMTAEHIGRFSDGGGVVDGVKLTEVVGAEINYLVLNAGHDLVSDPAVRKAIAQLVDRKALVHRVYDGTSEPLYSMVPRGIASHTTPFYDIYREPNREKAAKLLADAGVQTPVPLTFWYTTDRYGTSTAVEFKELKRQLDSTGLFDITIKGLPWKEFQEGYNAGEYPVFGRGWFPDFPDADNYIAPFVGPKNALGTPYEADEITGTLLPLSRKEADRGGTTQYFARAQEVIAEDVRLLPLWQGRQYVASYEDVAGIEWSLDPSSIMLMSELHKLDW